MYSIIEKYMNKLTVDDVNKFALSKNCNLSEEELNFTFVFIKKNWREILSNPAVFDINRYKNHYSPENFRKIKQVYTEYFQKFANILK